MIFLQNFADAQLHMRHDRCHSQHRQIVFISPPDVKNALQVIRRSGIGTQSQHRAIFRSWGTPYVIRIDGDYNNQVSQSVYCRMPGPAPSGDRSDRLVLGADQAVRPAADKNAVNAADDVISWQ